MNYITLAEDSLSKILLGSFLNTLSQLFLQAISLSYHNNFSEIKIRYGKNKNTITDFFKTDLFLPCRKTKS